MDQNESKDAEHGYIRLALPLMAKHSVPTTPKNYAVWYEYVSGNNDELRKTVDKIIEKGETFSKEKNEILYQRFCTEKGEDELRELREHLQLVLKTILSEVIKLSGETGKYESLVSESVGKLSEDLTVDTIRNVVNEIIAETRAVGSAGKATEERLKETTEELDELQRKFEQAKTEAMMDFLTGVANRKAFDEALATYTGAAASGTNDLCLLLIDIDHFKRFNDTFGHIVGDEVLKFVTKKTKEIVKGRDFLARFGGEEFVVILPGTPLEGAKTVAENIRAFFAQAKLKSTSTSKNLGMITVSIGAACYRPGEPAEDFIKRSDQALYFAKDTGRNRVATESDV
jgi:diguanylate cyclase